MIERKPEGTCWEQGWEGHEYRQLRRLSRLSLPEKLAWLEEAQRLAHHLARRSQQAGSAH